MAKAGRVFVYRPRAKRKGWMCPRKSAQGGADDVDLSESRKRLTDLGKLDQTSRITRYYAFGKFGDRDTMRIAYIRKRHQCYLLAKQFGGVPDDYDDVLRRRRARIKMIDDRNYAARVRREEAEGA